MFKKDNFWLGVLFAFLIPLTLGGTMYFVFQEQGREFHIYNLENVSLFLIAANAVAMNFGFLQNGKDQTGKGMFITTGIFAFIYVVYFYLI